jgi:multimeric flavodoxin WrbA
MTKRPNEEMRNVLGIVGSTRKMGNSELAVKMISREIPESHSLNLIRLSDLIIKSCLGCYHCISKEGKCVQDDDMEILLDVLTKADGIILAVPVYFFGPNAAVKMIVDRSCMIYPRFERFIGKPCVIGITLGVRGKDGYTLAALGSAAMTLGLDIMGEASFLAAGLGEILLSEENHILAKELGRKLFSPKREFPQDGMRCQICGSQSFKFYDLRRPSSSSRMGKGEKEGI